MTARSASLAVLALLVPLSCVAGEALEPGPTRDAGADASKPHTDAGSDGGAGKSGGSGGWTDASAGVGGATGGGSGTGGSGTGGSGTGGSGTGGSGTGGSGTGGSGTGGSGTGGSGTGGSGTGGSGTGGSGTGGSGTGGSGTGGSGTGGSGTGGSDSGTSVNGFSVKYGVQNTGATSPYIECQLSVKNGGTTSVPVSDLKVRYYFTDEVQKTLLWTLNWSHISTSGANQALNVTDTVAALSPTRPNADSYVEFSFSSSYSSVGPGESADFSWRMNGPDQSKDIFTQTNDYSFDVSKSSLTDWTHVVLYDRGSVIWGDLP